MPQTFTVTVNPTSPNILSPGTYQDTDFRIIGQNNTIVVPVTLTVSSIAVTPQTLSFAYTAGSDIQPPAQNLTLSGQAVTYAVTEATSSGGNWIQPPEPGSGTLPANSTVAILLNLFQLQNLGVGTYQGAVTVTPSGSSSPVIIPVTLTVSPEPPVTVSPTTVNLNYQIGGANNQGAQQAVTLATTSTTALPYSLGTPTVGPNPEGCNWISVVNPASGTIPATTSAQVTSSAQSNISYSCPSPGLPAGTYSGSIPVAVTGGALSTSSIAVNLLVSSSPLLYLPAGALSFSYQIGTNPPAAQTSVDSAIHGSAAERDRRPVAHHGLRRHRQRRLLALRHAYCQFQYRDADFSFREPGESVAGHLYGDGNSDSGRWRWRGEWGANHSSYAYRRQQSFDTGECRFPVFPI